MDLLLTAWDYIRHLDVHLELLVREYRLLTYAILAGIIFCETGLVVTPFLPGDSLLFAAGAITATTGILNVWMLVLVLMAAAICGDNVNYGIGSRLGKRVFRREFWFLRRGHLLRTQAFYERHGGKTLVLARFIPIVRTFAPFVAGVGAMAYPRFLGFCLLGAVLWVGSLTLAGYYFGRLPIVKDNFEFVVLAIIAVSVAPLAVEWLRHRLRRRTSQAAD